MAGHTAVDDAGVIKRRRYPGVSGMTILAIVAALNVIERLARRDGVVVARETGANDFQVIDLQHRRPCRIDMTGLTDITGVYMGGRLRCRTTGR